MEEQKTGTVKKIKAVEEGGRAFRKMMYSDAHAAKERGQKIAWTFYGTYAEPILAAFGVVTVYPEQYATICAAKRAQMPFLEAAEAEGYPLETCGYIRNALGFSCLYRKLGETPPGAPEGGIPEPDMVVTSSVTCDIRQKVAQAVRRYWKGIPIFDVDVVWPQGADLESVKGYYIEYLAAELRRLVAFLEGQMGKRLDNDKLWHYIRIQNEVHKTYDEINKLRQVVPSPVGAMDMAPLASGVIMFTCAEETLDFFTRVRDEVKERVDQGIAAIPNEKYRFMCSVNPPPYHALPLFGYLENRGAISVLDFCFGADVNPPSDVELDDPIDTLAWKVWARFNDPRYYNAIAFPNHGKLIARWIEGSKVDGLVVWHIPGCRLSLANIYYRDHAEQILGRKIPTLFLEVDQVDPRSYSEADAKAKVDAFIEVLASSKR